MPELPDVEVFKRYADATALNQKIESITVKSRDVLEKTTASSLKEHLGGRMFGSTHRHGKYLFLLTDGDILVLHFGMTGFLKYFKNDDKEPPHSRLDISFSNDFHLAFDCQRKLGTVNLVKDIESFVKDQSLGPDALGKDFSESYFKEVLASSQGSIKSLLMNQKKMAGIGNVYSDEILFQAGIAPKHKTKDVSDKQSGTLYQKIGEVLETAIKRKAQPDDLPKHYIIPHRDKEERCPQCNSDLEYGKVSGRTSYWCPRCQK